MPPLPPTIAVKCKNCVAELQNANMKFCANCGSQIQASPQGNVSNTIPDMSEIKAKLKAPAIGMIVSSGINVLFFLFGLMWLGDQAELRSNLGVLRFLQLLCFVFILAFAFSIFGAVQMMNAKQHGIALTSAILNMLTILCGIPISVPFGIWAFIVLLKPEVKSAFASNSMRSA
jgi:hypothetical protein